MEICSEKCINLEKVKKTIHSFPKNDTIVGIAEIFKALSDPSRLKIVLALLSQEHCVCDIAAICSQSESAVSHQLRILRVLKIVKNRREGKIVYYSLDDDHVRALIQMSLDHLNH
ncbi:MAG: winged helix-turn-helix transcriptional regulator [Desulfobacula sp.]|nr:winged helix-turn-helix transcriptional regulator [Desulfobacula sp.]